MFNNYFDKIIKTSEDYLKKILTDKEFLYMRYKINAYKYTNSMNKGCLPYLEDIISYYFNEKNKNEIL